MFNNLLLAFFMLHLATAHHDPKHLSPDTDTYMQRFNSSMGLLKSLFTEMSEEIHLASESADLQTFYDYEQSDIDGDPKGLKQSGSGLFHNHNKRNRTNFLHGISNLGGIFTNHNNHSKNSSRFENYINNRLNRRKTKTTPKPDFEDEDEDIDEDDDLPQNEPISTSPESNSVSDNSTVMPVPVPSISPVPNISPIIKPPMTLPQIISPPGIILSSLPSNDQHVSAPPAIKL